jgi:iron complex outermembrane recepter protein
MFRFSFFLILLFPFFSAAQSTVSGIISDELGEGIPGADVMLGSGLVAVTEADGSFSISEVPYGNYTIVISAMEFDTVRLEVEVQKPSVVVNHVLPAPNSTQLKEVTVIGSVSTGRNTPIAVTKINATKISEELGSRDLPMILNATPGVYATQTGGGDGDSRITVRGFDQRNVGVLIDGVPVNDMENGWVYWSNWFGLDAITSGIQVQRGLGATKLALPSVGGTLNILTSGIGTKKGTSFKQEYGTGDFLRSTLSYNSGLTKENWMLTLSGSYKQGNGWVDGTFTQGAFFFAKVQKKTDKHLVSLSAFAAPQRHGQRTYNQAIQYWSTDDARDLGAVINNTTPVDRGYRFNEHYGYITRDGKKVQMNERVNYYNKPQITLRDFWTINRKLSISNIAYVSIGRGGGTRLANSNVLFNNAGHVDWDNIVYNNQYNTLFGGYNTDPLYHPTAIKSTQAMISSVNNHFWVGYLGQFNYEVTKELQISGGIDYRFYKGSHYQVLTDLLGGDYYVNAADKNSPTAMKQVGDKVSLNSYSNDRDGLVQWGGLFGQAEYTGTRWTAFVNVSGVMNNYKGIDYFQKKMIEVGDTVLRVGYGEQIEYDGQLYTSASYGAKPFQTDWKRIFGGTAKAGASFVLTENSNVYMNLGYLSRTPQFSNVVDNNTNSFFAAIKNEIIQAIEVGYAYANSTFGVNVNAYFTNWKNKPFPFGVAVPDPQDPTVTVYTNINGMDAIHKGIEVDLAYQLNKRLSFEGMLSVGDWVWNSAQTVYVPELDYSFEFDAKGVHVGDAAQTMANVGLRYEPFKRFYVKAQYQWFDRYYAAFNPFSLQGSNGGRESWKMPSYGLVNIFAGYSYKIGKVNTYVNGSIVNVLDDMFMTDATSNFYAETFDATGASVMYGQGLRFNVALGINF